MVQKKHKGHKHFILGVITGIVFLCFGIAAFFLIQKYEEMKTPPPPVLETRKSMVKELPEEFKKQVKLASPSAQLRVPILMYHYVEIVQNKNDKLRMELNIPPNVFEEQVETLKSAGYTFMTARELGDVLDGKAELPNKPVLLTFDDGHWDFATDVLPILEKYDVKATAYIIPGFIGGSDFMSQSQLETVVKSGLVDVGAHTVHHLSLKGLPYATVKNEVDESKSMLEDTYHISVVSFAYPNGSFDLQAVQLVKEDGFTTAVSTVPGIEQSQINRYFMYRLRPGYRTGQVLLNYLQQNYFSAY